MILAVKKMFSTVFYIGRLPLAPGTLGSLVTVVSLYFLRDHAAEFFQLETLRIFVLFLFVFFLFGVWVSSQSREMFGEDDSPHIIIDEVVGQLLTFTLIGHIWEISVASLVTGFVLFRFFDIVKPWPVYPFEKIGGGLGIMMDDICAGVLSAFSLHIIYAIYQGVYVYLA
jgi:phosphatidylglycerophosphatase A